MCVHTGPSSGCDASNKLTKQIKTKQHTISQSVCVSRVYPARDVRGVDSFPFSCAEDSPALSLNCSVPRNETTASKFVFDRPSMSQPLVRALASSVLHQLAPAGAVAASRLLLPQLVRSAAGWGAPSFELASAAQLPGSQVKIETQQGTHPTGHPAISQHA